MYLGEGTTGVERTFFICGYNSRVYNFMQILMRNHTPGV